MKKGKNNNGIVIVSTFGERVLNFCDDEIRDKVIHIEKTKAEH